MKQNKVPKVEYHKGEPSDKKPSPYRYDRIVDETVVNDSMGYWNPDNFGKIVQFSAPDGRVSMNNVNFPVMAISNKGEYNMQMPGQEYQYKGDFITEYPMAKNGGGLLNKTLTCPKCGWSWKAADGGTDIATCHKCGGTAKLAYGGDPSLANIEDHYPFGGQNSKTGTHFEEGGWLDQYQTRGEKLPESVLAKPAITKEQDSKYDIYKQVSKKPELTIEKKREFTPEEQAYSDKVKARIANPAADIGILAGNMASALSRGHYLTPEEIASVTNNPMKALGLSSEMATFALANEMAVPLLQKAISSVPRKALFGNVDNMMSLETPKGNMYGENQVLTQQSRLLDPEIKAKFFKHQAPEVEIMPGRFQKAPKDYGNRITPENYEDFVNKIHGSTYYDLAKSTGKQPHNLGIGNYGKPGMVYKDAPLNNLGKDIINAHEKNHGIFAGTLSKEMEADLLKPFETNKPIPHYASRHQGDEVLARMGQFKNAVGIGNNQVFTLGHLNLIRKNYANSFIDNGITAMLSKIKPGSKAEKGFLRNMNKYAFGITPAAIIGTEALQQEKLGGWLDDMDEEYRRGGQRRRRSTSKNIQSSINDLFRRNYDVYGPAGKNRYNPTAYKTGGWLDNVD